MERIKFYREHEGINQSWLKSFLNPYKKKREREFSKHKFTKGNLLDFLVTMPNEEFNTFYHVSNLEKPSGAILNIIDYIYENVNLSEDTRLEDLSDFILEAADKYGYGWKKNKSARQWGEDTIINKVVTLGIDYWQQLLEGEGKEVVTTEEVALATQMKNTLYNNPATKTLFKQNLEFQKDIYWEMEFEDLMYSCKGLLDIFHETANTVRVIDIKATDVSPWEVDNIIRRLRYDIQVVFYSLGIKELYPNHNLLNPRIIFCYNNFPDTVTVIELSDEDVSIALNGTKDKAHIVRKQPVLGIKDAFHAMTYGYEPASIIKSNLW